MYHIGATLPTQKTTTTFVSTRSRFSRCLNRQSLFGIVRVERREKIDVRRRTGAARCPNISQTSSTAELLAVRQKQKRGRFLAQWRRTQEEQREADVEERLEEQQEQQHQHQDEINLKVLLLWNNGWKENATEKKKKKCVRVCFFVCFFLFVRVCFFCFVCWWYFCLFVFVGKLKDQFWCVWTEKMYKQNKLCINFYLYVFEF